jgi:hypothetical protein
MGSVIPGLAENWFLSQYILMLRLLSIRGFGTARTVTEISSEPVRAWDIDYNYWMGKPAIPYEKFTIDCAADYGVGKSIDKISPETIRVRMKELYDKVGLVYVTNTGYTEWSDLVELTTNIIPRDCFSEYIGGVNPRERVATEVYEAGAYDTSECPYHHEMSYNSRTPKTLAFLAKDMPVGKGATFVSASGGFSDEIVDTELGRKLREKGLCYVRHWSDREHFKRNNLDEEICYNHW